MNEELRSSNEELQTLKDDNSSASSAHLLIVEDNIDSSLVIQFCLEDYGYQIHTASNGATGLALAKQFSPAIIISDIGLTNKMAGYTFARAIRADAELQRTYLMATSGYGQPEDKKKAKEAGFDIYLTKPIDLEELKALIMDNLSQRA